MQLYHIPSGVPFVEALTQQMMAHYGHNPLAMARLTVILPTRRAVSMLRDSIMQHNANRCVLLPRLCTVGDGSEDDLLSDEGDIVTDTRRVPSPSARMLLLAHVLTQHGQSPAGTPFDQNDALVYAASLVELLDSLDAEQIPLSTLRTLDAAEHPAYRQHILSLLEVVMAHWPTLLAQHHLIEPHQQRNNTIAQWISQWQNAPTPHPVWLAGATGGTPAEIDLMKAVLALPQGTVILPGVDTTLSPHIEQILQQAQRADHPQHALRHVCHALGADAATVPTWAAAHDTPLAAARRHLWREVMRPADAYPAPASEQLSATQLHAALQGMSLIETDDEIDEARIIALLLRQVAETPHTTGVLVTPDRALSHNVTVLLHAWGIMADNTAGMPLCDTNTGIFARLVIDAVERHNLPLAMAALLEHPLLAPIYRSHAALFDKHVLRQSNMYTTWQDWYTLCVQQPLLHPFVTQWQQALQPLFEVPAHTTPAQAAAAYVLVLQTLTNNSIFNDDAGKALATFLHDMQHGAAAWVPLQRHAALQHLARFTTKIAVRGVAQQHPRIQIRGTTEARLQHADVMILGGLNEGIWPQQFDASIWLSHGMRQQAGLSTIERKIGQASHDMVQTACGKTVYLVRARKNGGRPTMPSRRVRRLKSLVHSIGGDEALTKLTTSTVVSWNQLYLAQCTPLTVPERAPCPPVALRPKQLSVTDVPLLQHFAYGFYAKHMLQLKEWPPLLPSDNAALFGKMAHKIAEYTPKYINSDDFIADLPHLLPAYTQLPLFTQKRLQRVAQSVFAFVQQQPQQPAPLLECAASCVLTFGDSTLTLSARADRVQGHTLVDYKTGSIDKAKKSPQLPLTALVLHHGGLCAQLPYVWQYIDIGGDDHAAVHDICQTPEDAEAMTAEALAQLKDLWLYYQNPQHAYVVPADTSGIAEYSPYRALAGV